MIGRCGYCGIPATGTTCRNHGDLETQPPALHLAIQLEEMPRIRIDAATHEDEQRLRAWIAHPQTRRRISDAILDALETEAA